MQRHYLQEVGRQIYMMRLAGYLFFGTIVGVEKQIREILADEAFEAQPLSFLVLDLSKVDGVDFSAAEAFTRILRLLRAREVQLVMCGFALESNIGQNLLNVGLMEEDEQISFFDSLDSALEFCENDLLKTFYQRRDALLACQAQQQHSEHPRDHPPRTSRLDVPAKPGSALTASAAQTPHSSPRRGHMHEAATSTLQAQADPTEQQRWARAAQPLQLLLQTFALLSAQPEAFWQRAVPYLARAEFAAGTELYAAGAPARAFYLLQTGILRARYVLPQGAFAEVIVAGATCGELPFFGGTRRTSSTVAERDCVCWVLTAEAWARLQADEVEVARELLKISLMLTSERMDAITKYMLLSVN